MKLNRLIPSAPRRLIMVLTAASILLPAVAVAQVTGSLIGTVRDEQGAAIPGAQVRLTSPAMIGGTKTEQTKDDGQFRFQSLTPGVYALEIEMLGFTPRREEEIRIGAGATLQRHVSLQVKGVKDSIVVRGTGSITESIDSGFETRFGPEYIREIPWLRYSMFDLLRAAPGVSPTSPTSRTVNTVSAFGSGVNENLFLTDGLNGTCVCQGVSRVEPNVDAIQEIQIKSMGATAEFGNFQGAVFNVITKQGGNRFVYDASYYGQASSLTSQPIRLPVPGTSYSSGYERDKYRDFTTSLGGPVSKDRLWFFTAYQYLRDYDSQPGTNPEFPRAYEQNKIFGKLTWKLTPKLQLVQSFHEEFWVNPQIPTAVNPFDATERQHAHVPQITFGHLTYTSSSNTMWDVNVGRFVYSRKDDPSSGNWNIPNRFDRVTNVNSGAPQLLGELNLFRTTVKATVSHYQHGLFGADHALKIGGEIEKGEHNQPHLIPTGTRFVDNNGQPYQPVSRDPGTTGGMFIAPALFATDTVTVGDRLTFNAGVRFDHNRAVSQDLPAIDLSRQKTGVMVHGLGTLYTWNLLSPRLGVTARLSGDTRTLLRASYGRFYQGMLTGEVSPNHPGVTPITTMAFDPATGDYTTLVSVVDPTINLRLDPEMQAPRTDEYSIGVDRELGSRLSMSVAYIHKKGSHSIAWTDVGGQYVKDTRTMADGRIVPVQVLVNSTADRRFLLTNPEGYSMTYDGLVIAAEKRMSNGWQAFASYTYSRVYGLQPSSATTADGAQLGTIASFVPNTFGQDPNDLTNARGRLPNDRPHIFRLMGKTEVPRIGVSFAANLQYFSGKPWAATAQIPLPQGDRRIFLEPRGSRRLPSQTLLDLRLSKAIRMSGVGRVEFLVDVFNVLNITEAEALASDNLYSPNFGRPTVYTDPRRAMIGVRLTLDQD